MTRAPICDSQQPFQAARSLKNAFNIFNLNVEQLVAETKRQVF
jgi:hypothetical protein